MIAKSIVVSLGIIVAVGFSIGPVERGNLEEVFSRFLRGEASEKEALFIKALVNEIDGKVPTYMKLFARGILFEKRGDLKRAIESYLSSIKLKPDYNPSYFRFNELIRKVDGADAYRDELTTVLRERFSKTPSVILTNPRTKYVLIVEKMSQYLMIYKGKELVGLYPVTTGKDWEDKWREGDKRTPEGVYYFTRFIPPSQLSDFYGGIAVALNYPNPVDRLLGKGGSGIWLHGSKTGDRNRIPFSTRGCVVAGNPDLRKIVKSISLKNTLIGIYKEVPEKLRLDDVVGFIESWRRSWEDKDVERYLSHYSRKFQWRGGGLEEWERYKRRVILGKKFIKVSVEDLTVLAFRRGLSDEVEYYVAEFYQVYTSDSYSDRGIKRLYILKDGNKLSIVHESFEREG